MTAVLYFSALGAAFLKIFCDYFVFPTPAIP